MMNSKVVLIMAHLPYLERARVLKEALIEKLKEELFAVTIESRNTLCDTPLNNRLVAGRDVAVVVGGGWLSDPEMVNLKSFANQGGKVLVIYEAAKPKEPNPEKPLFNTARLNYADWLSKAVDKIKSLLK